MASIVEQRATADDLLREEGKAELIGGRIVRYMASGHLPSVVAFEIALSLRDYAKRMGRGHAYADGIGFMVPELSSGRESFSPDASYYVGPLPARLMRFVENPPTFAVEVRSENDYGKSAEVEMAAKRADYFAAGTLVVWDVDVLGGAEVVRKHDKGGGADTPVAVFRRGDTADAEPAVLGFTMPVDDLFE